jgi:dihydroorotate dehydrogenase (NAD+) catalytic subunit
MLGAAIAVELRGETGVAELQVRLGRLELKNPVLVASGTFGYVRELTPFLDVSRLGGVIPKTVTSRPRAG